MENYLEKYLIYKNKYLNLKNELDSNKIGGSGYFMNIKDTAGLFVQFKQCILKIDIIDTSLLYLYLQNNLKPDLLHKPLQYPIHMSLLQFEINLSHPLNRMSFQRNT